MGDPPLRVRRGREGGDTAATAECAGPYVALRKRRFGRRGLGFSVHDAITLESRTEGVRD